MAVERSDTKTVTLNDVAKAAGVAPMTVSRCLNQHPNVSEKTKRKVASAIKRTGYTPNIAARILMGAPSNAIGLIVPSLSDNFFSEIAHNVQATAREAGKLVWVAASDGDPGLEASILEQMKQHHVDGLLIIPAGPMIDTSNWPSNVPTISLDRPLSDQHASILVDNRGGAAKLVEHLISHGYKRILCISTDPLSIYTVGERIAGYQDMMRKHRLEPSVFTNLDTRARLATQVKQALEGSSPPEAIFATNNVTTIYLLEALFQMNASVPGDVAFAGFDDFELAAQVRPGVTVVRQAAGELGRQGAKKLLEQLANRSEKVTPTTTLMPTSLILRGSCGCPSTGAV